MRVISEEVGPLFLDNAAEIEHVFSVRNLSDTEPMKLEIAKRACSCSTVAVPPQPVAPGATGLVKLAVSVPYRTGIHNAAVQLKTGQSDDPDLLLRLSIPTYRRISVEPPAFPVAELRPGSQEIVHFDVMLCQPLHEPKVPIDLESLGKHLTIEVLGQTEEQEDKAHVTRVHCRAKIRSPSVEEACCLAALVEERIRIRHGERSATKTIRWRPKRAIIVEPKKVFLHAAADRNPEKIVRLHATEPFAVVSVGCKLPFVEVLVDSGTRRTNHELRIQIAATDQALAPMATTGHVEITTDHPEQKLVRLPVFVLRTKSTTR